MDDSRFDSLTRAFTAARSRRGLLRGLTAMGLATTGTAGVVAAKKKKPTPNEFGCLDIGQKCNGKDSKCCSGVCKGKKPKKGEKDKSKCVAHNAASCTAERSLCALPGPSGLDAACNLPDTSAVCLATTGKAGFCAEIDSFDPLINCRSCNTDKDCEAFGFTPGSACVIILGPAFCGEGCAATGNRACMPPAVP